MFNLLSKIYLPFMQAEGASSGGAGLFGGGMSMYIMIGGMILIMYFFMIRPQSKKQKEMKKMLEAIKKGDKVVSIGGIRGTVHSVKGDTVIVKVDDNTKMEFNKTAIATVLIDKPEVKASKETKKTKEDTKENKE